jgi:hypothetical protein
MYRTPRERYSDFPREIIPFASMRVMKASPLQLAPGHRSAAIDHPE